MVQWDRHGCWWGGSRGSWPVTCLSFVDADAVSVRGYPAAVRTGFCFLAATVFLTLASTVAQVPVPAKPKPVTAPRYTAADVVKIQAKINAAIDKGVRWLRNRQARDGSWHHAQNQYLGGQTALSTYTLIKCGLPPDHPSVRRPLAYLESIRPRETYTVACLLLALYAAHDAVRKPQMQMLAKDLLDWQGGSWGYPFQWKKTAWNAKIGRPDLSNTQYAALGLLVAHRAGIAVSDRVWRRLITATFEYQRKRRMVDGPAMKNGKASKLPIAGFSYYRGGGKATGSMTCAGLTILAICREGLGDRLSKQRAADLDESLMLALNWLGHNFAVDKNPGAKKSWIYYYLYGLERVGGLLRTKYFGGHHWYYEGAEFLIAQQKGGGEWAHNNAEADTCFALLFLKRATAPLTGVGTGSKAPIWNDAVSDLRFRAAGDPDVGMWITGFSDNAIKDWIDEEGPVDGLRIAAVEYLIDGKVAKRVVGNPATPWRGQQFAYLHEFKLPGRYKVSARACIVDPEAPTSTTESTGTIEGKGFTIEVGRAMYPWMMPAATARRRNRLVGNVAKVQGSSFRKGQNPRRSVDGLQTTGWLCRKDDETPWLRLTLRLPIKTNRIVLSPFECREVQRDRTGRIVALEVWINKRSTNPLFVTMAKHPLAPTVVDLPRTMRVQQLRLCIVERLPGKGQQLKDCAGFAEISLELTR